SQEQRKRTELRRPSFEPARPELRNTAMATKDSSRPLASVMTQVVSDLAFLLQTEIRLARAEIGEKLSSAANGGMLIGIGAVRLLPGIFGLLLAMVRRLEVAGLPDHGGLLLVGAVTLGFGAARALMGS